MMLPEINVLLNALGGEVPSDLRAGKVLSAAFALATMGTSLPNNEVRTEDDVPVSVLLDSLGWGDRWGGGSFAAWMRTQLAGRIDAAVPEVSGAGNAVLRVVDTWIELEEVAWSGATHGPRAAAVAEFRAACEDYTRLRESSRELVAANDIGRTK